MIIKKELLYSIELINVLNNNNIVAVLSNNVIKIWNEDLALLNEFQFNEQISSIAANNNDLLIGTTDSNIAFFNMTTRKEIFLSKEHNGSINALVLFQMNGFKYMASGASDSKVKIWNISNSYELIRDLTTSSNESINSLVYSSEFSYLISGSSVIEVFSCSNYEINRSLNGTLVFDIAVTSDLIITSGRNSGNEIIVWNSNLSVIQKINCDYEEISDTKNDVYSVLALKNNYIAAGCYTNIRIWNSKDSFAFLADLKGHTNYIRSLAELNNGYLVSASEDYTQMTCSKHIN